MDDDEVLETDSDLSADDADDRDETAEALSDEAEPSDADDAEDGEETDEEPEDLATRIARLEADIADRDRAEKQRVEQETQERYRQQRQLEIAAEQKEQRDRADAIAIRNGKRVQVNRQLAENLAKAQDSDDPTWARHFYLQQHEAALAAVDHEYDTWLSTYNAAINRNKDLLIQDSNRVRYAEHVRQAMRLPASALEHIMFYANGEPVRDVNDFPNRAAEIYERRTQDANDKRAKTRQQREQGREERRARSGVPGRTRAPATVQEIDENNAGDLLRDLWAAKQQRRAVRSA